MSDESDETRHLRLAVEHRTTIGVALGILMERYDISQSQAFQLLQSESSRRERKLYDLCVELGENRTWPDP